MDLTFHVDYWDTPKLKHEYMRFLVQMFRLDLTPWDKAGFWDSRYRPFSFFCGESLVSNVCIYSMEMTIRGEQRTVAQVSAVGTLPEFRRKGLSRRLTHTAMEWARDTHDFFFLFADDDAFKFYQECGFRLTQEHKAGVTVSGKIARPGIAKLDMQRGDHVAMVHRLASERVPVSNVLGVFNTKLFMFWCLTYLKEFIHYIGELDLVVIFKREGGLLTVFDIVGAAVPAFSEIYPYICHPADNAVEFLFMVDKMKLEKCEFFEIEGNGTHVYGDFPLEGSRFLFPFTSHA